jgi:hypothetical protein
MSLIVFLQVTKNTFHSLYVSLYRSFDTRDTQLIVLIKYGNLIFKHISMFNRGAISHFVYYLYNKILFP